MIDQLKIPHNQSAFSKEKSTSPYDIKFHSNMIIQCCKEAIHSDCITHYHTMPHFDALKIIVVENIVRKEEIACNKQFLLFSQCFSPYTALIFHFKCTLECHLQFVSIWTSLKFCRLVMGKPFPKQKIFDPTLPNWKFAYNNSKVKENGRKSSK